MQVILKEKKPAKGIYGIFPANQVNDDDIELTENEKHYKHFDATSAITKKNKGRQILPCLTLLLQRFW
jgi:5-methyltetrahydrofolate--homocysteine methyltransferase